MLIIPDIERIEESVRLAREYALGFEYNDFYQNMDDTTAIEGMIEQYLRNPPPERCTLHGAFFDLVVGSADLEIRAISRKRIAQSIEIGKKLKARAVVFHTNTIANFHSRTYQESWLTENAAFYADMLSEHREIDLFIENMFDESPELLLRLSERLSAHSNYGVCLDFAHASLSQTGIARWVEQLSPYIRHVHINDCDGREDNHLPLGRGVLDIPAFFALLERNQVKASILLEVKGVECQRESLDYLRARGILR